MPTTDSDLKSGIDAAHLAKFRVIRDLGCGYHGHVVLAEVKVANGSYRSVAVKFFPERSKAHVEMSVYENLPHSKHIVQCFGCAVDARSGKWFIALEHCTLGSLRDNMNNLALPRVWGLVSRLLREILCGLDVAHRASVAHRDLKPENILLQCGSPEVGTGGNSRAHDCFLRNSHNVHAKLTDFGMAKQAGMLNMTSGSLEGTMFYIAPERLIKQTLDSTPAFYMQCDIYAYGLICWEVMNYVATGNSVTLHQALFEEYDDANAVMIDLYSGRRTIPLDKFPAAQAEFVRKCTAFDVSQRFKSAKEALLAFPNLGEDLGDRAGFPR